jgi:YVTN family beta-propeller protein
VHFTPDGRFGFTPERDQDSVSKVDLAARSVVQTVRFPAGSRPWMLRVAPDGKHVWVQTGQANTNVVLDADTMEVVHTTPAGKQPVQSAFQPGDGRYGLVTHFDDTFVLVLDRETGAPVTRIEVGRPQANASFAPDGATAFVTVTGGDEVVAIDMAQLAVVARIKTGRQPMGLALLDLA